MSSNRVTHFSQDRMSKRVQYEPFIPATKIPRENAIPVAGPGGKLDPGWMYAPSLATSLAVTQTIAADTNFSLTSSGTGYTHSGDAGALPASAAEFNAAEWICVWVNGILQEKGVGAIWVNATTLKLNKVVDNGDRIFVLS